MCCHLLKMYLPIYIIYIPNLQHFKKEFKFMLSFPLIICNLCVCSWGSFLVSTQRQTEFHFCHSPHSCSSPRTSQIMNRLRQWAALAFNGTAFKRPSVHHCCSAIIAWYDSCDFNSPSTSVFQFLQCQRLPSHNQFCRSRNYVWILKLRYYLHISLPLFLFPYQSTQEEEEEEGTSV